MTVGRTSVHRDELMRRSTGMQGGTELTRVRLAGAAFAPLGQHELNGYLATGLRPGARLQRVSTPTERVWRMGQAPTTDKAGGSPGATPRLAAVITAATAGPAAATPSLEARALGLMRGLAVGNVLGLGVELLSIGEIARRYPDGVTTVDPHEAVLPPDDDLAQACAVARAILDEGDSPVRALAEGLLRWKRENGRGCGRLTARAIELMTPGTPPLEAGRIAFEGDPRLMNGGLMRIAPVALAYYASPRLLTRYSDRLCAITHFAPACRWSCVAFNVALALLLRGGTVELPILAAAAREDGAPADIVSHITAVPAKGGLETLGLARSPRSSTFKALQAGLWAATTPLGFAPALTAIVSAGGDTDTNGAIAGAALGARYGAGAIPQAWLDGVPERAEIDALAGALLERGGQ